MKTMMARNLLLIKVLPHKKTGAADLTVNAIPFEVVVENFLGGPPRRGWLRPEAQKMQWFIDTVKIGEHMGIVCSEDDVLAWDHDFKD